MSQWWFACGLVSSKMVWPDQFSFQLQLLEHILVHCGVADSACHDRMSAELTPMVLVCQATADTLPGLIALQKSSVLTKEKHNSKLYFVLLTWCVYLHDSWAYLRAVCAASLALESSMITYCCQKGSKATISASLTCRPSDDVCVCVHA